MRAFDRIRYLRYDWAVVAEIVGGDPSEWVPDPLVMAGSHEFSGHVRVLGAQVLVDLEVHDSWRDGAELSRRIVVAPRYGLFAGAEGDLVVTPEAEGLTEVRFVGRRVRAKSGVARPLEPVTAWLLVTRFTDEMVARLDEAAAQKEQARFSERPDESEVD